MIIPIPFTTWSEKEARFPKLGMRSWRWTFDIAPWSFGLHEEVKMGTWENFHPAGRYINLSLTKHWFWGEQHDWYDGPHCSFSIGYFHINWSWNWCDKCREER